MNKSHLSSPSVSLRASAAAVSARGAHAAAAEQEGSTTTAMTTTRPAPDLVLVVHSEAAHDRHGRPYLRLSLRMQDGRLIEARWWRYPYPLERRPHVGQVCRVWGVQDQFGGQFQLRVQTMRPAPDVPVTAFVGAATTPADTLCAALDARIA